MADQSSTILHVDMDAFYAAVEQRDRPELRGKPVIVGGIGNRGVVCAASYEARPFGVRSAIPIATARRLCPHAVFLPVRMGHYAEISRQIHSIFLAFTPLVEPLSLDEAFLDVHGCEGLFGPAPVIARRIKERIKAETDLTASVGVAPNKFLAKLASDHGKPDGLVVIAGEGAAEFLAPLPVGRIWGIGARAEQRLHAIGVYTVGQLAGLSEKVLVDQFGSTGQHLRQLAHGQDDRIVVPDRLAKSISTETTFAHDIADLDTLHAWLVDLTDQLAGRLRRGGIRTKTVEVKIRSADFTTRHRAQALADATNHTEVLWRAVREIAARSLTPDLMPVRLLGVGATRLTHEDAVQGDLFEADQHQRREALDQTVDAIRGQFGRSAIRRGSALDH